MLKPLWYYRKSNIFVFDNLTQNPFIALSKFWIGPVKRPIYSHETKQNYTCSSYHPSKCTEYSHLGFGYFYFKNIYPFLKLKI